jgi:hypothetical protein
MKRIAPFLTDWFSRTRISTMRPLTSEPNDSKTSQTGCDLTSSSRIRINACQCVRAGAFFVWNPNPCFSVGAWGFWLQDSAGFRQWESFPNPVFPSATVLRNTAGTRNLYEAGFRPYVWITDNIAIQAQIYGGYTDNVRGFEASSNPTINPGTLSPTAFGRSGAMGVFTIAPTIKPRGGFFTRPELRVFATYSIWSDSLKGSTASIQEGGNVGGFSPAPYAHSNQGWLLGTQAEWYF